MKPETVAGATEPLMAPICREKAITGPAQGLLAMQKVEGSSPFSRLEVPANRRFWFVD
jgi:hypothetical protein